MMGYPGRPGEAKPMAWRLPRFDELAGGRYPLPLAPAPRSQLEPMPASHKTERDCLTTSPREPTSRKSLRTTPRASRGCRDLSRRPPPPSPSTHPPPLARISHPPAAVHPICAAAADAERDESRGPKQTQTVISSLTLPAVLCGAAEPPTPPVVLHTPSPVPEAAFCRVENEWT